MANFVNAGQVAINTAQGLGGLRAQQQKYSMIEEQRESERSGQAQAQQAMQEGAKLLQGDDPLAVAQWSMRNPEQVKNLIQAAEIQDQFTSMPLVNLSKQVLSGQMEGRAALEKRVKEIESGGGTAPRLRELVDTGSDEDIDKHMKDTLAIYQPKALESYMKAQGGGFNLSEGQRVGARKIFNDGTILQSTPQGPRVFGPSGELLTGEDAKAQLKVAFNNEIALSGGKRRAGLEAEQDLRPGIEGNIRAAQEQAKLDKAAGIASETTRGRLTTTRRQGFIRDGITAAEGIPTLRRTLELLDTIKTGGLAAASLSAKQRFGVEGADEGELSANLGKAVLSQLRETFGAAFTEREGERLEKIEASFTKSAATNRRLINNLITIMKREARRGIAAAKKEGDNFGAEEIQSLLDFKIGPQEAQQPAAQPKRFVFNPATGKLE